MQGNGDMNWKNASQVLGHIHPFFPELFHRGGLYMSITPMKLKKTMCMSCKGIVPTTFGGHFVGQFGLNPIYFHLTSQTF